MIRHKYTNEEDKFLIDNVKGISLKELTDKFNQRFNINLSESAIANRKNKLHLSSGITGGQFQKGHEPINKGKKWDDYISKDKQEKIKKTWFEIGRIPHNHRNVFEERLDKDGYIEIKIKEPKTWQQKHRYIYEQTYGKIPKGYKVIFLDGNYRNFNIDNLKLVSNAEHLIMNKNKLRFKNKELTETGLLVAKIFHKRGQIKSERL